MKSSVDVDLSARQSLNRDCLKVRSKRPPGSGIWGLDVGPLQDEWYPYNEVPTYWRDPNFQDLADDLELFMVVMEEESDGMATSWQGLPALNMIQMVITVLFTLNSFLASLMYPMHDNGL
ncbi:hypothetical protein BDQ17DRAFT_1339306 [Cyathus striatus]|nr:hypothetical protein BDQ17DRAFT_1339306 [Cyathus striatus]